jgi:purine-binding chemotaxis protein CheW
VDILTVQEIIRYTPITAVPDSPDFIEGVINLRGNIIPVIDLRKRLNLYKPEMHDGADTWIIILQINTRVTGFIVDRVTRVLKIETDTMEPPPDIVVAGLKSQYIRRVCKVEEKLLILLDFDQILMTDEILELKTLHESRQGFNSH